MDKNLLISRLKLVLAQLDVMHEEAVILAAAQGIEPKKIRNTNGELMLTPIFVAQANVLAALANLRDS